MFETIILPAISYGLSATSLPGPVQAYLLNVTLNYGWRRGLLVIFSPLLTDGPIILITVFLLGQLPDWAIQIIRIVGGALLLWIAWGAWQQLKAGVTFAASDEQASTTVTARKVLGTASAMNIFSPGPYLFWGTVNGPLLLSALETSPLAVVGMLLGFYGTFLGGMALMVIVFNRLGQISADVTRYILLATIALLVWFGTSLIAEAFNLIPLQRVIVGVPLVVFALLILFRSFKHRSLA